MIALPQAAASDTLEAGLQALGYKGEAPVSLPDFLAIFETLLESTQRRTHEHATDLGDIARHACVAALNEAVEETLPALWLPTSEDVQAGFSSLRKTERFANLAQLFFARFVERVIHYYVDRNLHHLVGADRVARSVRDLQTYDQAIRRHCGEAALIMRSFAKDWLGKNKYRDGRDIERQDVRKFTAFAVQKLRKELEIRKGQGETI